MVWEAWTNEGESMFVWVPDHILDSFGFVEEITGYEGSWFLEVVPHPTTQQIREAKENTNEAYTK